MTTIDEAVSRILQHAGSRLVVALPLGLGKPNRLANALYRAVANDPSRTMEICTALSLALPEGASDLERRFLQPFVERHFGKDYPALDYVRDLHADTVPPHIEVREFYLQSGAWLDVPVAQRHYTSLNYTHVARAVAKRGVGVLLQLVARRGDRLSLSCNPDLTLDLLAACEKQGRPKPLVVAVVHRDLPFLGGGAEVPLEFADVLVDEPETHALFALPAGAVSLPEYALGLHASTLVEDGGTLQIGIGALSDAIVHALLLRQRDNATYRAAVAALDKPAPATAADAVSLSPFTRGLYGASEMVMDGFMHLRKAGILRRLVFEDLDTQLASDAGTLAADDPRRARGNYLHGAFFLGTKALYEWLRTLSDEDFRGLSMTSVSHVNELYGCNEALERAQRYEARFFNTCMMHTLLGAAVSDALADGRVVSGVGGQYNFVAMAHALDEGRSILMLRAVRDGPKGPQSNIVWNYAHTTIPRHLRDIVVTEYGIAELRGASDEECIERMLAISDARFVDALAGEAKRAGKLRSGYAIPDAVRANRPEILKQRLAPFAAKDLFPTFPFGSDFDADELRLIGALKRVKQGMAEAKARTLLAALRASSPDGDEARLLRRLGLERTAGFKERLYRGLVLAALRSS